MIRSIAAVLLAVLIAPPSAFAKDKLAKSADRELKRIVAGVGATEPVAGATLAVMVGDELVYQGAAGCAEFVAADDEACARRLTPTQNLRVASISKLAGALGADSLVAEGRLDLDRDISDYLGWRLRNPAFPDRPITTRHLLAHLSSIRDGEEYWVDAPAKFPTLFGADAPPFAAPDAANDKGPGAWFEYANLNYGVLAAVIEKITNERFDLFMRRILFEPHGFDAGFNWSGVSRQAREDGAALHRRTGEGWEVSVDAADMRRADPASFRAIDGLDRRAYLAAYQPGDNPTLFSPQGGLRMSTVDLARLARLAPARARVAASEWRLSAAPANGADEKGYFAEFGLGAQIVPPSATLLGGASLIGHPGEAYGLYSGAWHVRDLEKRGRGDDISFAFAVTGVGDVPAAGAHPTFNAVEERLVALALKIGRKEQEAREPRPFDEKADAGALVDATLAAAQASGKRALFVLGGDWCHDSRGLAMKFANPQLAEIIRNRFETAFIDVGQRDRNLDIAKRFGVETLQGTPTVLIVSKEGALLNAETAHDWRTADSKSLAEAVRYFSAHADDSK